MKQILIKAWYTDPELNSLNLNQTIESHHQHHHHHHHGSSTPNNAAAVGGTGSGSNQGGGGGSGKFSNDSECSSVTSDSIPAG